MTKTCEDGKRLWKTLAGEDVRFEKKHRIVTVKLSSFCLIEFVDDEDYEADDVPRKAMAIIFGILRTPAEGSKTQVSLVDCDPCVIAAPVSIKPSSMRQQASISLDVSSSDTTIAKYVEVRQDGMTLASFSVPDATINLHELTTPQQADRCFSFDIPAPLSTEECPVEVRNLCEQHGLVVYEGAYRIAESVAELHVVHTNDGGDINDTKEATSAPSLASFPAQSRRRSSVGVAPSPDVPTIKEDDGDETPLSPMALTAEHGRNRQHISSIA